LDRAIQRRLRTRVDKRERWFIVVFAEFFNDLFAAARRPF